MKYIGVMLLCAWSAGYAAEVRADEADAPVPSVEVEKLVFGSFRNPENANNWAARVRQLLNTDIIVEPLPSEEDIWYRVATGAAAKVDLHTVGRAADSHGLAHWRILAAADTSDARSPTIARRRATPLAPVRHPPPARTSEPALTSTHGGNADGISQLDVDLGLQTRGYRTDGFDGQSRFQPSLTARLDYHRAWDNERQSFTFTPFARFDGEDEQRTHFDVRELFWSRVGNDWDLHIGAKQVFWGVTEFHHLVDIINQTDLVENIDGEDKLGQPMVHLSFVRDWGIVDLFALTGFRERTYPGADGRLRAVPVVDVDDPIYESGAEDLRVDGAIRWSRNLGAFEFGLYHFSGTSREPQLVPWVLPSGEIRLRPRYPVIDQTGLDAEALFGGWALKLEAISRAGYGDRYAAMNVGFEKTLIGVMKTRTDLGLVAEYMFDDRDDEAYNTVFEHDVALGTRLSLNDVADTQALLGIIWDLETEEYVFSLEASRRLGETWTLLLEGRVFGGAEDPNTDSLMTSLFDADNKTTFLQRDDFIQLELTRYF